MYIFKQLKSITNLRDFLKMTKIDFEQLKEKLTRYGQEHLLRFWEELNEEEKNNLVADINDLDLEELQQFFKRATASLEEDSKKLDDRLKPVLETTFMSTQRTSREQLNIYELEGK